MSNSHAHCDCKTGQFEQTKLVYNIQADGLVCVHCDCYPVYIHDALPVDTEMSWRAQFSSDLRELLATWDTGEAMENLDLVDYWERENAG